MQGEVKISHWGTVDLVTQTAIGSTILHLHEVLYIPSMTFSLLSLQLLIDSNVTRVFNIIPSKDILDQLLPNGTQQQIGLMSVIKGRLTLDYTMETKLPSEVLSCELTMSLLHCRLGHGGKLALQRLLSADMATGVKLNHGSDLAPCDACQLGKMTIPPHPSIPFLHNTTFPLQLIVMDVARPVTPQSLGGSRFILNILDFFTRYSWTMTIKSKDKVAKKFMVWKPVVEMQSGTKVHVMRTNCGGEFISHAFKAWLIRV